MRIAVLTSLYPTAVRPFEGLFAQRRWTRMRARGHDVQVVQPLPFAPRQLGPGRWTDLGRAPAREERGGVPIVRPRFLHVPSCARSNARRFARSGSAAILAGPAPDVVVADYAWPAAMAAQPLRAAALLQEHSDIVLFANYRVSTVKADVGFNKKVTRALGSGERVLYTEERPAFLAKNRYGLPDVLPLDWPAFAAAMPPPIPPPGSKPTPRKTSLNFVNAAWPNVRPMNLTANALDGLGF